jgi:hypothetical protein
MTQITEKNRNEIALAIGKLSVREAEIIKAKCNVHMDTVYRVWSKMRTRGAVLLTTNDVVVELIVLAAARKTKADARDKRVEKSMKQLSAKSTKQAA